MTDQNNSTNDVDDIDVTDASDVAGVAEVDATGETENVTKQDVPSATHQQAHRNQRFRRFLGHRAGERPEARQSG